MSVASEIREGPGWRDGEMARAAGSFGDKPLIVLTAGRPLGDEMQEAWIRLQAGLARLSTRGRQVIVWESDHGIPGEAPEAVAGAVREVVGQCRRAR